MQKALTISIEADMYDALQRVVGRGKISKFLQNLAHPHVMKEDSNTAYLAMAADPERVVN